MAWLVGSQQNIFQSFLTCATPLRHSVSFPSEPFKTFWPLRDWPASSRAGRASCQPHLFLVAGLPSWMPATRRVRTKKDFSWARASKGRYLGTFDAIGCYSCMSEGIHNFTPLWSTHVWKCFQSFRPRSDPLGWKDSHLLESFLTPATAKMADGWAGHTVFARHFSPLDVNLSRYIYGMCYEVQFTTLSHHTSHKAKLWTHLQASKHRLVQSCSNYPLQPSSTWHSPHHIARNANPPLSKVSSCRTRRHRLRLQPEGSRQSGPLAAL